MLYLVNGRHFLDDFVVACSEHPHDRVLFAFALDTCHYFCPIFPFGDYFRNHLYGILEITAHQYGTVSGCLQHAVIRAVELPEILGIEDSLDFRILLAEFP